MSSEVGQNEAAHEGACDTPAGLGQNGVSTQPTDQGSTDAEEGESEAREALAAIAQTLGLPANAPAEDVVTAARGTVEDSAALLLVADALGLDEGSSAADIASCARAAAAQAGHLEADDNALRGWWPQWAAEGGWFDLSRLLQQADRQLAADVWGLRECAGVPVTVARQIEGAGRALTAIAKEIDRERQRLALHRQAPPTAAPRPKLQTRQTATGWIEARWAGGAR